MNTWKAFFFRQWGKENVRVAVIVVGILAALVLMGRGCGALLDHSAANAAQNSLGTPKATVKVNDAFMQVTNDGTESWGTAIIYINGRPPFTFKAEVSAPAIGQTITIPLNMFVDDKGNRFNPSLIAVIDAWIGGGGYDYRNCRFR